MKRRRKAGPLQAASLLKRRVSGMMASKKVFHSQIKLGSSKRQIDVQVATVQDEDLYADFLANRSEEHAWPNSPNNKRVGTKNLREENPTIDGAACKVQN